MLHTERKTIARLAEAAKLGKVIRAYLRGLGHGG
jgi:hypothetical protein